MEFYHFWIISVVFLSYNTLYVTWGVIGENTSTGNDISDGSYELSAPKQCTSDFLPKSLRKRLRQSENAPISSENSSKKCTFIRGTKCLDISLSEERKKVLSQKIQDLYNSKDPPFEWPGLDTVLDKDLDHLCRNIWSTIDTDIKHTVSVVNAPCIATKIPHLENHSIGGYKFVGLYGFPGTVKYKSFSGDFVKCNCLYEKYTQYWSMITVKNSQFFFYIHKFRNDGFFILSNKNTPSKRQIQIIDFCPLKDDKER